MLLGVNDTEEIINKLIEHLISDCNQPNADKQGLQTKFIAEITQIIKNTEFDPNSIFLINKEELRNLKSVYRQLSVLEEQFNIQFQDLPELDIAPQIAHPVPLLPPGPTDQEKLDWLTAEVLAEYAPQEKVLSDTHEKTKVNEKKTGYGVTLKNGTDALNNPNVPTHEMNILFMGTAGALHFGGKHKDVYEGGDVLCHLGLHKGMDQSHPTCLLRGVGTAKMESAVDYMHEPTKLTGGTTEANVQGTGVKKRLRMGMEQFFIPNLLQMVHKNTSLNAPLDFKFNVVGHSRGAITSYAMVSLIDVWMKDIAKLSDNELDKMADKIIETFSATKDSEIVAALDQMDKADIVAALNKIKDGHVNFKTKLMLYDPVEGRASIGDRYGTSVAVPIFGETNTCDYKNIPPSVTDAQIFLGFDERRNAFQPTISGNQSQTAMAIMPVIGVHGTMKGYFSKHDDQGQDSYLIEKDSLFLKEALRASADLVKIKSTRFLFDVYPPLDKVTLCNVFYANQPEGYSETRNHLLEKIEAYLDKPTGEFNDYIEILNLSRDANNQLTVEDLQANGLEKVVTYQELINLSQWMMSQDQNLTKQLYCDIERDVHNIYLSSKDEKKIKLLGLLREEMRTDTTQLGAGLELFKQATNEDRIIWQLDAQTQKLTTTTLKEKYPQFALNPYATIWSPQSTGIGSQSWDYMHDPYYFNLLDTLSDNELTALSKEEYAILKNLSYDFAEMNLKGAIYSANMTDKTLSDYTLASEILIDKLKNADINQDLKSKIASIIILKEEFDYKIASGDIHDDMIFGAEGTIDNPFFHQAKLTALKYQADSAIQLLNDDTLNKNPILYKEINKLRNHINEYIKNITDPPLANEMNAIEKMLINPGEQILKSYLQDSLASWDTVIKAYREQWGLKGENSAVAPFEQEIKQIMTELKLENLSVEDLMNIETKMNSAVEKAITGAQSRAAGIESRFKNLLVENQTKVKQADKKPILPPDHDWELMNESIAIPQKPIDTISKRPKPIVSMLDKAKLQNSSDVFYLAVLNADHKKMQQIINDFKKKWTGNWFDCTSSKSSEGNTALHLIVGMNDALAWNMVMNSEYTIGFTRATTYRPEHIFNFLAENNEGDTPLDLAVKEGNVEMVKQMQAIYTRLNPTKYSSELYELIIKKAEVNSKEKDRPKF